MHRADPNGAMSQCHFATVPYPASPLVLIYDSHSNGYNQLGTDEKVVGKQTWSVIHRGSNKNILQCLCILSYLDWHLGLASDDIKHLKGRRALF